MKLYHGTTVPDMEILEANSRSREGGKVLYLTDNFPYSLFYIRDRDIDFVTCGVGRDGVVHYDEKFPGQLEALYRGLSGWVYEVEAEAEPTKVGGVFVTAGNAVVTGKRYIPDAWEAILAETAKGNVEILAYEDTTAEQRALNREGIVRWLLSGTVTNPKKKAFLRAHFPEAWEEARQRTLDKPEARCYDEEKERRT